MKLRFILAALPLLTSFFTHAETCQHIERYKLLGSNLEVGDVVTLEVGNTSVSQTIDNSITDARKWWPAALSDSLNRQLPAKDGASGSSEFITSLGRYISDYHTADINVVDVFKPNTPVTLSLNGQDYSHHLIQETPPTAHYSGEAFVPHWFASTNRHLSFFVSNHSEVDVNVDVELNYYNGNPYGGSYNSLYAFAGNNPVASTAVLKAGQQGQIGIGYLSGATLGQAKISWTSTECVDKPLSVTVSQHQKNGAGMSHYTIGPF